MHVHVGLLFFAEVAASFLILSFFWHVLENWLVKNGNPWGGAMAFFL